MVTSGKREKKDTGCTPFVMVFNLRACKESAEDFSLSPFPLREKEAGKTQSVINNQVGCGSFKKWLRCQKSEVNK